MKRDVVSLIRQSFGYLIDQSGFRLAKVEKDPHVPFVVYQRHDVSVVVSYEVREQYMQVVFFRAADMEPDGVPRRGRRGYSLDDIVHLRQPSAVMKPWYECPSVPELADYVDRFAANLRTFASDLLSGDLSVLPAVEVRVTRYIERLASAGGELLYEEMHKLFSLIDDLHSLPAFTSDEDGVPKAIREAVDTRLRRQSRVARLVAEDRATPMNRERWPYRDVLAADRDRERR